MVLKNYFKVLAAYSGNDTLTTKTVTVDNKTINTTASLYQMLQFGNLMRGLANGYGNGAVVGDGDTPATVDDYCLSGNVITGVSGSTVFTRADDEAGATWSVVLTITNGNADDVTIKEVGICVKFQGYNVLLERTVLDSPVTIPAGGVGQITYTIRMNYPTA